VAKTPLDKDLKKISALEAAARAPGRRRALTAGLLFLILLLPFIWLVVGPTPGLFYVLAAGVIGGYMALNIGANDVANNVGPAVGSKALTMAGALVIAAVCEAAGAMLAGSDVVGTIAKGIVAPSALPDPRTFVLAMTAALLAAALWLNLATWIGAPVSTTHSIVGGVLGVGVAAGGLDAVGWNTMGAIAASWVISPLLGGVIAAVFLAFIKLRILGQRDRLKAAATWVPVLVGVMGGAFTAYLMAKGVTHVVKTPPAAWAAAGLAVFAAVWAVTRVRVRRAAGALAGSRKDVARLFTGPLIVSAALLSFAHGANDVANAVGPLAAIVGAVSALDGGGLLQGAVRVPGWVLLVGALGIAIGLVLFGPKLIHTVGEQITRLDPIRAFCVALSAAVTVLAASGLGLPVSSTHIAVGGVFGVGFLREWHANRGRGTLAAVLPPPEHEPAAKPTKPAKAAKQAEKSRRRRLVRRQYMLTIATAWVVTVPLAAVLAAGMFKLLTMVLD
jgi:PiT family inorganic phosphate transporter